jgi:hypothetical protein
MRVSARAPDATRDLDTAFAISALSDGPRPSGAPIGSAAEQPPPTKLG